MSSNLGDAPLQGDEFRAQVRAWLRSNCPKTMQTTMTEGDAVWGGRRGQTKCPDARLWLDRMVDRGWTAPTWPVEYGGAGLSNAQASILQEEMKRIQARPPLLSLGLWMLGPALLEFGTPLQKRTFLPPIARGEIRWCQGYSEPGAGSDLASLNTKCVDQGDHLVVSGQKTWTSYGHEADWMFCLVRTGAPKREGISFVLFDMESPGVECRPIELISGRSQFSEVFLNDVVVPKENVVGGWNNGWRVAKRLLQHERQNVSEGGFGGPGAALQDSARAAAQGDGVLADGDLRARISGSAMEGRALKLTMDRARAMATSGTGTSHLASMQKIAASTWNQQRLELQHELLGSRALGWADDAAQDDDAQVVRAWLRSKGNTIEGGTTEINLDIIAKRVLGL